MSEIASVLKITNRAVNKRAGKEAWPCRVLNKRGDKAILVDQLPTSADDVRLAITARELASPAPQTGQNLSLYSRCVPVAVGSPDLPDFQNKVALARADLLRAYLAEKAQAKRLGKSQIEAADDFLNAYNTGRLLPAVFAVLGSVARPTIEALKKAWRDSGGDYMALAPRWGNRKGQRKVTPDELNALLGYALHPNRLRISEIVRYTKKDLARRSTLSPSSPDTLRRALLDWKNTHYDQWVFAREGEKALNDKCLPYIERDKGLLNVGDVLVADGHTLNFDILHPFTGKPGRMTLVGWYDWASCMLAGWEIMPTENIQCVAAGLRRAILALGKMPKVAYLDNGRAFKSKCFNDKSIDFEEAGFYGMFARLGIEAVFAWPYNAQSKPIERFFGVFSELERLMPTFTGTCIADKPARLLRHEKLHARMHEIRYGGWVPTIEQANTIIAGWLKELSARPTDGLDGLCPIDVWDAGKGPGVDKIALRHLMMSMETKSPPGRNGIWFLGRNYYDPALYGYKERVTIRYDFEDLSGIEVYDLTGTKLLCEALPVEGAHPMARLLGRPEDMALVQAGIKQKRALKRATEAAAREYVANAPALVQIPQSAERMAHGANGSNGKAHQVKTLPQGEAEHIEREASRMKLVDLRPQEEPVYMSEADRYEAYLERDCTTRDLTTDQLAFMRYFEKTEFYRKFENRFVFLREQWLVPDVDAGVEM